MMGKVEKILLIRNDRIGDLILSLGVIKSIRQKYPDAQITFMASSTNAELLKKSKDIDRLLVHDNFWHKKSIQSFINYLRVIKKIRNEKFDIGIDLRGSALNILFFLWAGGIGKRVAPIYYSSDSWAGSLLTNPVTINKWQQKHSIMTLHELLVKGFGSPFHINLPEIDVDDEDIDKVTDDLAENNLDIEDYICICPGAGNNLQRWPGKNFDSLIKRLEEKGETIILVGGEPDRKLIEKLAKNNPTCLSLINYNIRLLSLLFLYSKGVICNDGGPMHISWASGARTLALWGPTIRAHVGPLNNSTVVQAQMPCYPCVREKGCSRPKEQRCMDKITVTEVMKEVKKWR